MRIPVHLLSYDLFNTHPVWTWAEDDDESLVDSLCVDTVLPCTHSSLFVRATVALANGTKLPGALSIRCGDQTVYMVTVFLDSDEYEFHLILKDVFQEGLLRLAKDLNLPVNEILPLSYSTIYRFEGDFDAIAGSVDENTSA